MQSQTLTCPICFVGYDQAECRPKLLPVCGHTICMSCLDLCLKDPKHSHCPLDFKPFPAEFRTGEDFPLNFTLSDLIEELSVHETCEEHQEKKRLLCFTDKTMICDDCAHFGEHKGHDIRPMKNIKPELDSKKSQLEVLVETLDRHCNDVANMVDQKQIAYSEMIRCRFTELQQLLEKKELELLTEAKSFFSVQKQQVHKAFGVDSTVRQGLLKKAANYRQYFKHENIFNLVEEDISATASRVNSAIEKFKIQQFDKDLKRSLNILNQSLISLRESLFQADLPLQSLSEAFTRYFDFFQDQPFDFNYKPKTDFLKSKTIFEIVRKDNDLTIIAQDKEPQDTTLIDLSDLKDIEKVVLIINKHTFTKQDTATFFHVWRYITNLTSFELVCNIKDIPDNILIDLLSNVVLKAGSLKAFSANLSKCKFLSGDGIFFLFEDTLPYMVNLRSLKLVIYGTEITDENIESLAEYNTKIIKNLYNFEIDLGNTPVTDKGINQLFVEMPQAKSFNLNFRGTKITDDGIKALAQRTLASVDNLQSFELYISETQVSDRGLLQIFDNMKHVKKLRLGLGSTKVGRKTLESLGRDGLLKMEALEDLKLFLYRNNIKDEDMTDLCVPNAAIKSLSLTLQNTKVSDKSIEKFAENTLSSIKTLEHLEVSLSDTSVTDNGALKLFKNIDNLKTFKVYLHNTMVTNKFGEELAHKLLPQMKNLVSFSVSLNNTGVSGEIIKEIEEIRKKVSNQ